MSDRKSPGDEVDKSVKCRLQMRRNSFTKLNSSVVEFKEHTLLNCTNHLPLGVINVSDFCFKVAFYWENDDRLSIN